MEFDDLAAHDGNNGEGVCSPTQSKETKAHYLDLGPVHFTKPKLC